MSTEFVKRTEKDSQQTEIRTERRAGLRRLAALLRDDARRHRLLFVSGLAVLGVVATMAYSTYRVQQLPFDLRATTSLQGIRYGAFANLMIAVSLPGYQPWSPFLVAAGGLLVAWWLGWRDGLFLGAVTAMQGLSNQLIKHAIGRPRPAENLVDVFLPVAGRSFPSGHVMLYTVFFGFLFFLAWTQMRRGLLRTFALIVTAGFVLLVGPSRIFLGAHWLSDVVAGYLVSLIIVLFAIEFYVCYVVRRRVRVMR
ncbi:MAG: phosphatase PAP2 family protein [Ardenticatenaceae bacterium]